MTIMPIPLAARALVVSWALTAATALNAIPVAAQPRPKASEPAAGSPVAARAAPLSSPRTQAGAEADHQGGAQRGVASQPSAAEQFQLPALLVGAGVPDRDEHHEDRDGGCHERGVLDHGQ